MRDAVKTVYIHMAAINTDEYLMLSSAVRGFHIYKEHWSPAIDDTFVCWHEPHNSHDIYATGVYSSTDDKLWASF